MKYGEVMYVSDVNIMCLLSFLCVIKAKLLPAPVSEKKTLLRLTKKIV